MVALSELSFLSSLSFGFVTTRTDDVGSLLVWCLSRVLLSVSILPPLQDDGVEDGGQFERDLGARRGTALYRTRSAMKIVEVDGGGDLRAQNSDLYRGWIIDILIRGDYWALE